MLENANVLLITGMGRSGTTAFWQWVASHENTIALFEPYLMKEISFINEISFKRILFNDLFLPELQGRVNHKESDWTYYKNYLTDDRYAFRCSELSRKEEAIEHIKRNNPLFVIKANEFANKIPIFRTYFSNCFVVNLIRDGREVIASSLKRGWYKQKYNAFDYGYYNWLEADKWNLMNPQSRAAVSWAILNKLGEKADVFIEVAKAIYSQNISDLLTRCKCSKTHKTDEVENKIISNRSTSFFNDIIMISDAERELFLKAMQKYGFIGKNKNTEN